MLLLESDLFEYVSVREPHSFRDHDQLVIVVVHTADYRDTASRKRRERLVHAQDIGIERFAVWRPRTRHISIVDGVHEPMRGVAAA
jgi:hypothetical protein